MRKEANVTIGPEYEIDPQYYTSVEQSGLAIFDQTRRVRSGLMVPNQSLGKDAQPTHHQLSFRFEGSPA